jgi:general secretion pathway protein I
VSAALLSRRRRLGGFTLLEVMIAVVILAVGLSSLFTSEAGAIRIAQRARTTTVATLLARCKMGELEEKILKEGWPGDLLEGHDECCEEGPHDGFGCDWKVERIKMPDLEQEDALDKDDNKDLASLGKKKKGSGNDGILDQLAGLSKQEPGERLTGISDMFSNSGVELTEDGKKKPRDEKNPTGKDKEVDDPFAEAAAQDPMESMVMSFAFPVLKPVIEEGVRRASVTVNWKEGQREQVFEVVQFIVSEQQIILPDLDDDDGGVPSTGSATPSTGAGTTTTPSTGTTTPSTGATK